MEAHIGVGIRGKEGTQAVRSADYAIGKFKFLQKLILTHGRWGYRRVGTFICYYFYKNVILVFCELYFAFYNGFSGQIYYVDWLPMLYNVFWTSWPCIFTFIFERVIIFELTYFRMWQQCIHLDIQFYIKLDQNKYILISKSFGNGCFKLSFKDSLAFILFSMGSKELIVQMGTQMNIGTCQAFLSQLSFM